MQLAESPDELGIQMSLGLYGTPALYCFHSRKPLPAGNSVPARLASLPKAADEGKIRLIKWRRAERQANAYLGAMGDEAFQRNFDLARLGKWDDELGIHVYPPELPSATRSPRLHRAASFLVEELRGGRRVVTALVEQAQEQGIAERTLDRAKAFLEIRDSRVGFGPGSVVYWERPRGRFVWVNAKEHFDQMKRWPKAEAARRLVVGPHPSRHRRPSSETRARRRV